MANQLSVPSYLPAPSAELTGSCGVLRRPASRRGLRLPAWRKLHGNKSQGQRDRTLAAFRKGEVRTLIATDIAARGIDVDGISHVVNFDLPNVPETYVHRIGRTARAGATGIAISLCDDDEAALLRGIEKLICISLPVNDHPSTARQRRGPAQDSRSPRPARREQGRNWTRNDAFDGKNRQEHLGNERSSRIPASQAQDGNCPGKR